MCVGFTFTGISSLGKSLCGKIKNPRKAGILGRYLAGRYTGADRLRTPPNRGVSRGDGGGVRGCCGVVLSYNFLPESKTYIPVRWAFHLRKSCDISTRISQWDQNCAFIWLECARIRLTNLPPKLPPKGVGTVQHRIAPFCTHGTKSVLSLGMQ